ncbi:hypothetical protein PHSC3_001559 [Chlamydiales bacterium STE3]|nr:hypothetical protein PHSC3_001559 [Chlamydiales bacterium STE3]
MSLNCTSHTENCTVRNALLWGMCRSHFYQVQIQRKLHSRIVHLALAILEAIPVIGQIVSLIELQSLRCYKRPQPTSCIDPQPTLPARPQPASCIPQIATVASQESPTDLCRIWPTDLKLLRLTEAQKTEVDSHVRDAFRALTKRGQLSFVKKRLKYTDGIHTVDAALPITLSIFKENAKGRFRVMLFPKTIFASGGERKIRWAYDLTTGTFLLKKRITGIFEEKLLNYLLPLRNKRDIQNSVIWRISSDKQNNPKLQIIEPVRDGTLATLFGTAPLSNFSVKRDLIMDLLTDLNALHAAHLSGITITSEHRSPFENASPQKLPSYAAFHSDIKPLNVLAFFQNGKWRAELCDFGAGAAHPTMFTISVGFTPPEYICFYQKKRPFGIQLPWFNNNLDIAQFNIKHGQGRDVWAIGLVILSLLVEREEEVVWENVFKNCRKKANIPPLPCLKSILSGRPWGAYEEEGILDLKQATVDADLNRLKKEIASKHPKEQAELARIFEMLKEMMLRIDPNKRKTIAQCLAFLQEESRQIA